MAVIRNLVVKIAADISSLSKGLQTAEKTIQKVSASLTRAGTKLTAGITVPLTALATKSVTVSKEFEQSMANAASVAGATGEELARMTGIAREMGSKTVFSASQAADALYYMASAGYKVDQMADSIEATLNLASATQSDLAFTTDTVISALNQFGLEASEAERVTNVYASAIGNSMANLDKLSNSMSYVGPVAHSLGYSIEEATGALSVLYNAGYDGSQAGTTLRQALVSLMNPSAAAKGIFEELGLVYEDINPATNDFATILDRLAESRMDTAQAMKVFGARGGPGMLAMMSAGGDAVREMTESITGTSKATEMAAVQLDTLEGQTKILKSELEEIAISFGDVLIPIIRQFITKYISPLTARLMGLSTGEKKQVVMIAAIAAAIGPLLLVLGKLTSGLASVLKVGKLLFSKVGLIIVAIAAVVAVIIYLWKTNEGFRDAIKKIWEKIQSIILKAVDTIKQWWKKNGEAIKQQVITALETICRVLKTVIDTVVDIISAVWPYISGILTDILDWTKSSFEKIWNIVSKVLEAIKGWWESNGEKVKNQVISALKKILTAVRTILQKIRTITDKIWNAILKVVVDVVHLLQEIWEKDGEKIFAEVSRIFNSIWAVIQSVLNVLITAFQKFFSYLAPIWEKVKALIMSLWDTFVELYETLKPVIDALGAIIAFLLSVVSGVIDGIMSALGPFIESVIDICNAIIEIIRAVCAVLRGDWSDAWEHMKNVASNIWESIKHIIEGIWEFIKGFGEGFVAFWSGIGVDITEIFRQVWENVSGFFERLWQGIKDICSDIGNFFVDLFNTIKNFFVNIGTAIGNFFVDVWDSIGEFFTGIWDGISTWCSNVWGKITGLFSDIGDFFAGIIADAFNWGANLISNIWEGIQSAWNWVVDGVKSIGQSIADFLGFGSPTKKGPCHYADEWIPNLMSMMEEGMYDDIPNIEKAATQVANSLNVTGTANRAMVGTGTSPFGEMLNGLLQGFSTMNGTQPTENRNIVLEIDGQSFARIIMPKLNKEYKRNGIVLKEV